jgi:competence protein ComEA
VVLAAVVAVAAIAAAVGVWRDRPVAEPAPPLAVVGAAEGGAGTSDGVSAGPGPAGTAPTPRSVAGGALVVSVAGKVRRPGLVRLAEGARVADAITQAGGPLRSADLTLLNLARRVADGEQILVGVAPPVGGEPAGPPLAGSPAAGAGGSAPAPSSGGKINLNQATVEQLDTLPGVGPVTAQRILDWRTRHGRFSSVEQLREVEGIGERRFGQLRDQVTL